MSLLSSRSGLRIALLLISTVTALIPPGEGEAQPNIGFRMPAERERRQPPPPQNPNQLSIGGGILDRDIAYPRVSEGRLRELETLLRGGVGNAAYELAALGSSEARNIVFNNSSQTPRFALAAFPSQEAVDLLVSGPLSRSTAEALTRIGPLAVDTLRRMIRNEESIGFALPVLAAIGDPRALPELVLATQNSDPAVVRNALQALGDLGDPRGANALRALTGDARHGQTAWTNLARIARPADLEALIAGHQGGIPGLLLGIYRLDPGHATALLRQQLELGSGPSFGQALSLTLSLPVTNPLLPLLHGIAINGNGRGVALARLAMADNLGALRVLLRLVESPPAPLIGTENEEAQLRLLGMLHLALAVSLRTTSAEGELRQRGLNHLRNHEQAPLFLAIANAQEAIDELSTLIESSVLAERVRALVAISIVCDSATHPAAILNLDLNAVLARASEREMRLAVTQAIGRCGVPPSELAVDAMLEYGLFDYLPNNQRTRRVMRAQLDSKPTTAVQVLARFRDPTAFSTVTQHYARMSIANRLAVAPYLSELAEINGPQALESLAALRRRAESLEEFQALFARGISSFEPNLVFRERAFCTTPGSIALTIENSGVFTLNQGALTCNAFPSEPKQQGNVTEDAPES